MAVSYRKHLKLRQVMYHPVCNNNKAPTMSFYFHTIDPTTTDHKEEEQLDDLKDVGESNYNAGDGTDQRVQSLVFMMFMMMRSFMILRM